MKLDDKKILIVDDDPISRHVLKKYLDEAHYFYVIATNGQEALEILQKSATSIALVIADRIMPKLHGLDLLGKMQQHPILQKIPFVLLTGEAEKEEVIEAIKKGVKDFLYKPVSQKLLLAVLKRILGDSL